MEKPLCRTLSEAQLAERKEKVVTGLTALVQERQEIRDGYVYSFPGDEEVLMQLLELILLERNRCPLFRYELSVRDEKTDVQLKITGPDGTIEFLKKEFNL